MRLLTGAVATIVGLISVMVLLLFILFSASRDEVSRVPSLDNGRDAVLVETNGGATTSFGYEVYIVPRGRSWRWYRRSAFLYGAYRNDNAYGVNLRWESPQLLVAEFLGAKQADVEQSSTTVAGSPIQLRLRGGITDPTAPPGGMLYNLTRAGTERGPNHGIQADTQDDARG